MPSSQAEQLLASESSKPTPRRVSQNVAPIAAQTGGPHLSSPGSSPNLTEAPQPGEASPHPVHREPEAPQPRIPRAPSCQSQRAAETLGTSEKHVKDLHQPARLGPAHRGRSLTATNPHPGRAPRRVHPAHGPPRGPGPSVAATGARLR